jgi:ATP-dependent DNA helicase RecG
VALLTGSVKSKARQSLYENIENGSVDVVVGTHALIQEKVNFSHLGFVVIDEQHRFGVRQRQALLEKAHRMPHLLAMTATPIPRSLQLTVYGELDISLLLERPAGRKPIKTEIISPNSRAQMYEKVDAEIAKGRQVYVVCPLIYDGVDAEQKSADAELRRLKSSVFKHRRMGLLHGKMNSEEKQTVMAAFSEGDIDILVSTTVVEVGVDVPNATAMIIEGADRFGLAQLHQLRGRVGRSEHQSYCYLVPTTSQKPSQRLRELEKSNDGFYLAEVDLALRGPGEIYGRSQHGQLNLRVANITDTRLLKRVREAAEWLLGHGNLIQYEQLHKEVERYQRLTTLN